MLLIIHELFYSAKKKRPCPKDYGLIKEGGLPETADASGSDEISLSHGFTMNLMC